VIGNEKLNGLSPPKEIVVFQCYEDILSRIAEEPIWFDEHAVPRFCDFAPDKLANIYARETALAEVTCQVCKRLFRVAFSKANWQSGTIADAIRSRTLHFGDPPNVCCCGNMHMNSEPRRVVEYWRRDDAWTRDHSLEIDIRPDWVDR
jgi:hypothetical protein